MDEPTPSLRELKKQQTRGRLLDAARDLFETQSYDQTSIEQIAAAAGVSRGTFFNYFPAKESQLAALAGEELQQLEAGAEREGSAVARIRATMRALVEDTRPFPRVTRYVLLQALQQPPDERATTLRLGDMLRRLVRQAQASGEIRADLDPAEMAQAILGAYLAAVFTPGQEPVVENIVDMLFEGIAGPAYSSPEQE